MKQTRKSCIEVRQTYGLVGKIYYLSYLLFKERGEHNNAKKCMDLAQEKSDLSEEVVKNRELGWRLKREGNTEGAKKEFKKSAQKGDPISQYELALLLGHQDDNYKCLIESASSLLIQAKIALYVFYLQEQDYEKAYHSLYIFLDFLVEIRASSNKELEELGLAEVFQACVEVDIYKLPQILSSYSLKVEDKQRKIQLQKLAASQGEANSVIALVRTNIENIRDNQKEILRIKDIIKAGKDGNYVDHNKFVEFIKSGNPNAIDALLEVQTIKKNEDYIIKTIEIECKGGYPTVACALGIMYYTGIGIKQDIAEGHNILKKIKPALETLANSGETVAQYQMGWIYKEKDRNYQESLRWFSKCAPYYPAALHELGELRRYGVVRTLSKRNSSEDKTESHFEAEVFYRQAAELDYAPSQVMLGWLTLERKDYAHSLKWFENGMAKGYSTCQYRLTKIHKEGDAEVKQMVRGLAWALLNNQEAPIEIKEWAKEILKSNEDTSIQSIISKTADNSSQQTPLVPQQLTQEEEKQKIDTDDSEKIKESSHNKQILSLTSFLYDNPQTVAEIQVSALMNFVGKNVSTPKTQMDPQHGKETSVFNEELRSFLPMKQPSLAKAPLVSLTQDAFLDEKLVTQAEYFSQTGVAFFTLQDAAGVGTVHMLGGLPPTEEESILDSALDWMGLSHLSKDFLEDFSHLL